ncbi:MAG: LysR family transcriptional regulator [Xanthobacteraceae bacterium]|nr:LysR family transcriptional regulator [Xanthobacteraceae bacterium]
MIEATAIRYFREVTRQGSIKRAAEVLQIAPSAISRQIQGLETELAVKLFERRARGISLTDAGELLYRYATDNRKRIDDIFTGAREFGSAQRGHVRIATVEGLLASFLASFTSDMARQYPGVTVSVTTVGSRVVADMVAHRDVDIGLVFGPAPRRDLFELARMRQALCLIVAPGHPFATRASCCLADLDGLKVILPNTSFGIRQEVERVAAQSKIRLKLCYETNSLAFARTIVAQTDVATFLPRDSAKPDLLAGRLVAVPLRDRRLAATRATLVQAVSQQATPACRIASELLVARMQASDTGAYRNK